MRTDWLDVLERGAQIVRHKDVKKFHGSNFQTRSQLHQSGEKNAESGEIGDQMIGNSQNEDVKDLRTTLSNNIPLESLVTTYSPRAPLESLPAATQQASNGRKENSERITEQDHLDLASLFGKGNVEEGFCRLCSLDEADANQLALLYRRDRSSGEFIRAEAVRLEENLGRPG